MRSEHDNDIGPILVKLNKRSRHIRCSHLRCTHDYLVMLKESNRELHRLTDGI